MDTQTFIHDYLTQFDAGKGTLFLEENASLLNEPFAASLVASLKSRADELQRSNTAGCKRVVAAMNQLAQYTDDPSHLALAHFAEGNMEIFALGHFVNGLDHLAQADALFNFLVQPVEQAKPPLLGAMSTPLGTRYYTKPQ